MRFALWASEVARHLDQVEAGLLQHAARLSEDPVVTAQVTRVVIGDFGLGIWI
jgi:hypothetical protein